MIVSSSINFDRALHGAEQLCDLARAKQKLLLRWESKQCKRWLKHPVAKICLRVQTNFMTLVGYFMRGLNFIERGLVFRVARNFIRLVAALVHQDGLRVAILLTVMGYAVWNYQMIV